MISRVEPLNAFLPLLRAAAWVAVDTEADSLHSYPEKLCVIQISLPAGDFLIDPLAGLDLGGLLAALAAKPLILHGADYDLRLLHRTFGFVPRGIFDTMWAARLAGITRFGLADLVGGLLDVRLCKASQKANWAKRPLTEQMAEYARNDTRHLKALADHLSAHLEAKGRRAWLDQCCERAVADALNEAPPDPDTVWRIKGSDRLSPRELSVFRAIWLWREQRAIESTQPPYYVLPHEALAELARAAVQGSLALALANLRIPTGRKRGLAEAIEAALGLPEAEWPHRRVVQRKFLSRSQTARMEALRERRDQEGRRLSLDPTLIASKLTLLRLAGEADPPEKMLLPWQRELLGL